jgi:hypothetical protein
MDKKELINKLKNKYEETYYGVQGESRIDFLDWLNEMIGKQFYGYKITRDNSGFLKIEKVKR